MSQSEARISAIVGIVFAVMILAAVFEEFSARRLSILFVIIFWAPMLVLHELGHALVAKLLGWRVREIVIGFGRDLWQWQSGETRVRIKLAPVEGYVLPAPQDARHVRIKSMLIYAAGPGAELLLLGLLLMIFGYDAVFGETDDLATIALQSLAIVILLGAGFNLLPFSTEGAVSDGLGIISSPFMSDASIELRLLTFELRELQVMLDEGNTSPAVRKAEEFLHRFPNNPALQLLLASAMSANQQLEDARAYVRDKLAEESLSTDQRHAWLRQQALIELNATEPSYLVLDLALQEALKKSPNATDLLAIKGSSLVLRGQIEDGGNMLADAWRQNDGSASDADILAYLTVAAYRHGDQVATEHFQTSFEQINRSEQLAQRVKTLTRQVS
ncbi:MAG: site-2 protease family protein [Woeseiaceae bacterium]